MSGNDLDSMAVMLVRRLEVDLIFDADPLIILVVADLDFYPQGSANNN